MGDRMSGDDGVSLLGNPLATLGILYVLITAFGKVSGAHFNPVVSASFWLRGEMASRPCAFFCLAQCSGAVLGCVAANGMFEEPAASFGGTDRSTAAMVLGEAVATFGLSDALGQCVSQ